MTKFNQKRLEKRIFPPVVPLTANNKKRIETILKRKDIVVEENRDDENGNLTLIVKNLHDVELIKYTMEDRTDFKILLNGELVADMGWDTFVNVGPKGDKIFKTIELIEDRHKKFLEQQIERLKLVKCL